MTENFDFDGTYAEYLNRIQAGLERYLPVSDDPLNEPMRYSLFAGGKRIRPILALAWCSALGGDENRALPGACALEMIHTYSLIHDDLPCMDNDSLRRGRPTNHVVYGESTALLAGSGLMIEALGTVLRFGPECGLDDRNISDTLGVLCRAAGVGGILTGQALDLRNSSEDTVDLAYLDAVNDGKTAAMLQASCEVGAIAAKCPEFSDAARRYGLLIGRAFQIRDDILDEIGTERTLGKTPGKDSRDRKRTYATVLGLSAAQREAERLTAEAEEILNELPDSRFLRVLTRKLCCREN